MPVILTRTKGAGRIAFSRDGVGFFANDIGYNIMGLFIPFIDALFYFSIGRAYMHIVG